MRKLNLIALFFIAFVACSKEGEECLSYDDAMMVLYYHYVDSKSPYVLDYSQYQKEQQLLQQDVNLDSTFFEIEKQKIYPKVSFYLDGELISSNYDELGIQHWTNYTPYKRMKFVNIVGSSCTNFGDFGKLKKGRVLSLKSIVWNETKDSSVYTIDISIKPNYVYGFFLKKDIESIKWNDGIDHINIKELECFNEICMFYYKRTDIICEASSLGDHCFTYNE
ncbi:MAG: hypothetical protein J6Q11_06360 [Fibrobacteraceae bacterium]|nr:hypothetical protein [Fibrobacteraceae bacterium]